MAWVAVHVRPYALQVPIHFTVLEHPCRCCQALEMQCTYSGPLFSAVSLCSYQKWPAVLYLYWPVWQRRLRCPLRRLWEPERRASKIIRKAGAGAPGTTPYHKTDWRKKAGHRKIKSTPIHEFLSFPVGWAWDGEQLNATPATTRKGEESKKERDMERRPERVVRRN